MAERLLAAVTLAGVLAACGGDRGPASATGPYVVVLGIAQDGGYPQPGCNEEHCRRAREDPGLERHVSSLAIVDPEGRERWIVDATPDFPEQLAALDAIAPPRGGHGIAGVLLTHAHIGHYTGLMFLGREVMGTWEVPVHVMPKMAKFLRSDGPWDLLVRLKNIDLRIMKDGAPVKLNDRITVTPIGVPHREEYTEAVGFRITGPERTVLYVPDIDRWDRWSISLAQALQDVDVAYLDGTFYADGEVRGRDMSEFPHPRIAATMDLLADLPEGERDKVHFLHLNHTNPALDLESPAALEIDARGFHVAAEGERAGL